MNEHVSRDDVVYAWAHTLNMGDTLFKWLPVGAKFRFAHRGSIMTKTRSGYTDPTLPKRTFRAGARCAVFRVTD